MPETTATAPTDTLVEAIMEQLETLSPEELRTIQEFIGCLAWKRQRDTTPQNSAEARAIALA